MQRHLKGESAGTFLLQFLEKPHNVILAVLIRFLKWCAIPLG